MFLISTPPTAKAGEVLSGEKVKEILSGNTQEGRYKTKKFYTLAKPDGTLSAKWSNDKNTGTWRISDEGYWCRTWSSWQNGKEGCFELIHKKDNKYEFKKKSGSGSAKIKFKLLEGNPKEL